MDVRGILKLKGSDVATIGEDASLRDAIAALAEHRVGALVVSPDGDRLSGILSERDIVRALSARGDTALDERIGDVCTTEVRTCSFDDTTDELMRVMTEGRFRHCPVIDADRIVGLVSIGDVVRHRVDELEGLTKDLESYVSGTW